MASNLQLTDLEQQVLNWIKEHPGCAEYVIIAHISGHHPLNVREAIAQLVSLNFISQDENLRYHAVGGKL